MTNHRKNIRLLSALLAAVLSCGFAFASCSDKSPQDSSDLPPSSSSSSSSSEEPGEDPYPDALFSENLRNTSKTGMYAEYLGTTERKKPEVSDGGLARYPEYGVTLQNATEEEKQAIIDENNSLVASSSTYDGMDEEGNLYLSGEPTGKKLYKHTASSGMYGGDVSDAEPAVIKRLTIKPRSHGNHITGLYAPAGEPIKIEMSEADLQKTGGLTVYIGQVLTNGGYNNIWLARDFNRMPVIANTMTVNDTTAYVGSYLGGPVYIRPAKTDEAFTVTISGAVSYSHFVLGCTTREEFERNKNSTAPYFDLEVWDDAVRHSGPKSEAEDFSFDELTQAAILWDKIALVSNKVPAGSGGDTGITFLYDPFIAAGSMVAFVGRHTVNCPVHCLRAALDAESAILDASDAFWGCIHEFNHHYQRFGFAPGDEVTNNAVSLVEYSLFTRISSKRSADGDNGGNYAVGWNRYTNPAWALRQTISASAGTSANSNLDSYANLLHSFGQDAFIRAAQNGGGSGGADVWYKAVSDATGYDMTYYFRDLLHQDVSEDVIAEYAGKNRPVYVPVACVYQVGRNETAGGKTACIRTAQPYEIPKGADFEINLNDKIVLPEGFTYTVRQVTSPAFGELNKKSDGVYVYTPDPENADSGEIVVTLGIEKEDGAFEVPDTQLVFAFRQGQYRPTTLERTVYTYSAENMYDSAAEAMKKGYAGYETKTEEDNDNRVQNGNAEIWEPSPSSNAIMEIRGKFRISGDGRYRIALRARYNAALWLSFDGGRTYEEAAALVNTGNGVDFDFPNENNYADHDLQKGTWVYFKAALLVTAPNSFIGVGIGKFDGESVNVSYLNAYRNDYVPETFTSEYFYTRDYRYDYSEPRAAKQTLAETNYRPWDQNYPIDALFDEDDANFIHSDRTPITEDNPFDITVLLDEPVRANRFIIYGEPTRLYLPTDFELYGGTDPERPELLAKVENAKISGTDVHVDFEEREISFYKLHVTDTSATGTKYIAYRRAGFSYALPGGEILSPDEEMFVWRGNWSVTSALATFGHLYSGENATVEFTFSGTRFGVFSCPSAGGGDFEVLIDGQTALPADFRRTEGEPALAWLSDGLKDGTHTVLIRSKTPFNIDSFALWR